ncbi:MAG: DUF2178 domain-containing protein [Nanoarchaeota archaeon]|nr:DUF2178 domain-containing protein [Nanoarchaeota archaeon]MBU1103179.1 DUF2178 domain-containing protein [Nanoarchaeota archaeon]
MKTKTNAKRNQKIRLFAIAVLSLFVILTGALLSYSSFKKGEFSGGILGIVIVIIILGFAVFIYRRGNRDLKEGYPLQDERSKRVMQKAMATTFLVSLYLLLAIGWLSEDLIKFRDVSQATGVAIGGMAVLFLAFWIYYNKTGV